jgi:hypothetical protein
MLADSFVASKSADVGQSFWLEIFFKGLKRVGNGFITFSTMDHGLSNA